MTPSHANKAGRRYRYYVTRPDQLAGSAAWRVPAHDLERLVCDRIAALLNDPQAVHGLVPDASAETLSRLLAEAEPQPILPPTGPAHHRIQLLPAPATGRASRRERVCPSVYISVLAVPSPQNNTQNKHT